MKPNWQKIGDLISSRILIELALVGSFLAFSLNPGSIGDLMRICGAIFLANLFIGKYRLTDLTMGHMIMLTVFLFVLLINLFMPGEMVHDRSLSYFLAFPGAVLACHLLAVKLRKRPLKELPWLCLAALLLAVLTQFIVYLMLKGGTTYGVYSNLHHLGLFSSLTIPLLIYFFIQFQGWIRVPLVMTVLFDFYLLWDSSSRISWLSFFAGTLFTFLAFFRKKQLVIGLAALILLSLSAAYFSGFSHISSRLQDFADNWQTEERVYFWSDALALLKKNSIPDWLLGHGIGSFRYYFAEYAGLTIKKYNMTINYPHNVFLQIIFENGIIGFTLIFGTLFYLPLASWKGFKRLGSQQERGLLIVCFAVFWIDLIHCFLNKSLYSKYILYSLSVIVGMSLVLLEKAGQNKSWQAWRTGPASAIPPLPSKPHR